MADESDSRAGDSAGDNRRDAVPTRYLRSALEFAVLVAREGPKLKPPLTVPNDLRRYAKQERLTAAALNGVRRVLEADDEFRSRLAAGAIDDLVDEVGRLWLVRPAGWEDDIVAAVASAERDEADADLARRLKRAEKRREAAERAAGRSIAEVAERDSRLDGLVVEVAELRAQVAQLEAERDDIAGRLESAKMDARHARDRELAAIERARVATERADQLSAQSSAAQNPLTEPSPAGPGTSEAGADVGITLDPGLLERLSADADRLARDLAAIGARDTDDAEPGPVVERRNGDDSDTRPAQPRRPLRMPPGVLSNSPDGVRFLLRSTAPVLVDGYNVSKLAWSRLDLEAQRERLVTALEMASRRYGTEFTVVFDGADIVGSGRGRHTGVRVVFSAADESADDWIRAETRRLIASRNVVVVTNDREIIDAVVSDGANHLSSDQLIDLLD